MLQESIKTLFPDSLAEALATETGEEPARCLQALQLGMGLSARFILLRSREVKRLPGIYRMARVTAGSHIARQAHHLLKGHPHVQGISNMTGIVLGDQQSAVQEFLVKHTGLQPASVRVLLRYTVPAMLAASGEKIASRKLTAEGWVAFLQQHAPEFEQLLPTEIQLPPGLLLMPDPQRVRRTSDKKNSRKSGMLPLLSGKLKWGMVLVISAGALFYLLLQSGIR
ncbi:MAG TPA: hypothetical protein PKE63_02280 [Lacibacter sp.]|nr:hypothetical protein [Lacibacter sp.]HMO87966.1 hypothetical protein [Lacibacter sp.]HMP86073.1 hypothetical protein [Lacibacter sp.]